MLAPFSKVVYGPNKWKNTKNSFFEAIWRWAHRRSLKHGKNGEKWTKNAHFFKNYPRNVVYTVLKYNVTPVNGLVQLHYTSKYPDSLLMTNITSKIWEKMSKNEQNWHIFEKNWHIFEKNCFLLLYKAWYKKRFWNGIGKTCILGSIPYF